MKKQAHTEWEELTDQTKNVYFQLGSFNPSEVKKLKQTELVKAAYESKMSGYDSSPGYQMLEFELSQRRERFSSGLSVVAIAVACSSLAVSVFFIK